MDCSVCKWWKEKEVIDKIGESHKIGKGACHYEPPTTDGWPITKNTDYCSEFTKKTGAA